ncbi:MAG: aminoglycoside phosphotransferase [Acidimicrobiales bacterium]|nr:aminoglycoside phosphotransferase [Acidimicrobiales bacterium]
MRALAQAGVPAHHLTRADSVTNEVWLTDQYVVRVNRDASLRLHRESVLSQALPPEVGYPTIIQHGDEIGSDWLVALRAPGTPLSRWWPLMSQAQRREAVRQLAERLRIVHQVGCPRLDGLMDVPQLLDAAPTGAEAVARLVGALDRAALLPHVDPGILREVAQHVQAHAAALDPFDSTTIVHGDLSFENVLWDGERITALLDFEYARPGPADLDLDVLLRFVALPHLHVAPDYEAETRAEDYVDVPWWLAEDYPELFAHPRQFERMRIYSLAWDTRELLAFPPSQPVRDLNRHHPYHRMVHVLRGTSYLDRLNGGVSLDY